LVEALNTAQSINQSTVFCNLNKFLTTEVK